MKKIIYISSFFALFCCNDGTHLGNNYYYLPDYESVDIGYPYGSIVYKSHEKYHFDEVVIFSDINKITSNEKYIIVLQRPNKNILKSIIKDDLTLWNEHYLKTKKDSIVILPYDTISLHKISELPINNKIIDSIIQNKEPFKSMLKQKYSNNYYIIDKIKSETFGPFNKEEFDRKSKELKITLSFD